MVVADCSRHFHKHLLGSIPVILFSVKFKLFLRGSMKIKAGADIPALEIKFRGEENKIWRTREEMIILLTMC